MRVLKGYDIDVADQAIASHESAPSQHDPAI